MKTIIKTLILCGVLLTMAFSCEKEEVLPPGQGKGKIIARLGGCNEGWLMIEVDKPEGIGKAGTFVYKGTSKLIYKNAIGVPYFFQIPDLHTDAPDAIGTWLHFEYREFTDKDRNLFIDTSYHYVCPMNIVFPPVNFYIITKILDYH